MFTRITGRKIDYSSISSSPNVDTLCDVMVATQHEHGLEPSVREADYNRSGEKIRRFKRTPDGMVIDNYTGRQLDKLEEREYPFIRRISSNDDSNSSHKVRIMDKQSNSNMEISAKKQTNEKNNNEKSEKGLFSIGFSEWYARKFDGYDDDDDDDTYICEYCTELGYSGKYKAYICDNCTKCDSCSEFQNDKCDGCTYSRNRTGRPYSESLQLEQIVSSDDLELLENSKDNETIRRDMNNFSMLNY